MKLVATIRLLPDAAQAAALRETLERCNAACTWLGALADEKNVKRQYDLHHLAYAEIRTRFGLTAQAAVRCIGKVADSLKAGDEDAVRTFRPLAAQPFDERIFRFLPGQDAISIWTLAGRQHVAFVCGEHQRVLLAGAKGQVDLMFVRGKWLLAVTCDVAEAPKFEPSDVIGVDLGVVHLAVDNSGKSYSGADVERVRRRQHSRRRALQKLGTRSAKRALRRASRKQSRFQRHANHCISKAIVADAERGRSAIALEDLEGIRDRVKASRRQRARLHNWGFFELRNLIDYKATREGIPVLMVDPRNTSRQCSCCGVIDKKNRPTRDDFRCVSCGFAVPADHNAAVNIRQRGLVASGIVVAPQVAMRPSRCVSYEESRLL